MIKKIIHILAFAALMCSCVEEIPQPEPVNPEDEIGVERDGKVTLGFNVDLGGLTGETKALAETPEIQNIYVAVFDSSGYKLSEYVKADPITTGPVNDKKYQFTIQLKVSNKPRTLHFIANGPKELRFGTEQEIIGALYSRYDADEEDEYSRKDAYWQRLVFNKIAPRPEGTDDGSTAWQDYNSMVETLSNLKLIRNFSKVVLNKRTPVTSGDGKDSDAFINFQILGMWFVNYPDRGSIAPYNRNTGGFGTDPANADSTYLSYSNVAAVEDVDRGNYQGFNLASTQYVTPESFIETGTDKNMIEATSNEAYGYVFEREKALSSPMYLIAKCRYNGDVTYYKIAMQDENGSFYAMLRNFVYYVQVQDVTAAGYDTAAEALAGAPTGDISVNVDYQDLPNISDGNARMTVSATKLLIVGQAGSPTTAKFWYKYEPDITDHSSTAVHNDVATGVEATDKTNPHVLITYEGTEGSSGAVVSSLSVASDNEGGNRYVTITTTNVSETPKIQTVSIEGRRWDGSRYKTITRNIQLVLRSNLEMTLSASPNTDSENAANIQAKADQPVVLHIGIEQDLPESVFPLYFKVDPSVNSLTPDNAYSSVQELPARYGTDANGRPNYWFEKAVSLTEYNDAPIVDGMKQFPVYFKTIYDGDNATNVTVSNDLFESKTVAVKNFTPKTFSSLAFSGASHKVGEQENFTFHIDGTPLPSEVTLIMKGVEPVVAASPATTGFTGTGFSSMSLQKVEAGYWYYTLTPTDDDVSIAVVPYASGTVSVEVGAFLYTSSTKSVNAIPGDANIILQSDFVTAYGQKVFGDHNIVPNQKAQLTIYIPKDKVGSTVNVTIGGLTTTKTDNGDGYWKVYTGTNAYTAATTGYNVNGYYSEDLIVKAGTTTLGSVKVPICGIQTGTALTSASQVVYNQTAGTGWYIIVNGSGYHLYKNGTKLSGRNSSPYTYESLLGFTNTGSTVQVVVPSANATNMYRVRGTSNNTDVSVNSTTGQNYKFTGTGLYYDTTTDRYWRLPNDTGNIQTSTTTTNRTFSVLPVTLNVPE